MRLNLLLLRLKRLLVNFSVKRFLFKVFFTFCGLLTFSIAQDKIRSGCDALYERYGESISIHKEFEFLMYPCEKYIAYKELEFLTYPCEKYIGQNFISEKLQYLERLLENLSYVCRMYELYEYEKLPLCKKYQEYKCLKYLEKKFSFLYKKYKHLFTPKKPFLEYVKLETFAINSGTAAQLQVDFDVVTPISNASGKTPS